MKTSANLIIISLIFALQSVLGQGLPVATPEEVGFSSERLDRINPLMQSYVEENKLPGMLTMVARAGKVFHLGTYGKMRPDMAMKSDAICRIASMTKPITSTAVMILYEEGYFLLNDPVSKYLPQFESVKVFSSIKNGELILADPERPVTIHDLMTQFSPFQFYKIQDEFKVLVYQALID